MSTALRHPRFGRLLAALVASQIGDWLYNLALLAYVDSHTTGATWLGLTTAARVAPIVVAGPLGGVIADRFDRRSVMIVADVVRAAVMGLLVVMAVAELPVVLAPLLAAIATLAAAPYGPCVAATTVRLVDEVDLPAANAARSAIAPVCIVAGPALGAVVLLLGPPSIAFALNGVTFAISALLVASIPGGAAFRVQRGGDAPVARPTVLADLRGGAAALARQPAACRLVLADATCSLVYGAETVLLLLVARQLDLGADGYGYLLGAMGLGGIAGAALGGRLAASERRATVLVGALLVVAASLPLLAMTHSIALALVIAFVNGMGALVVEVLAETGLVAIQARSTSPPSRPLSRPSTRRSATAPGRSSSTSAMSISSTPAASARCCGLAPCSAATIAHSPSCARPGPCGACSRYPRSLTCSSCTTRARRRPRRSYQPTDIVPMSPGRRRSPAWRRESNPGG